MVVNRIGMQGPSKDRFGHHLLSFNVQIVAGPDRVGEVGIVTWRLRSPGADAPERSTPGDADAAAAAFADIAAAATADAAAAAATDGELDDSEDYDAEEDEKLRGPWESPII